MSGKVVGWAFDLDISPAMRKFVLVALADNAAHDGVAWPSQQLIAHKTGLSERAVRDHLAALEEQGYLSKTRRVRGQGRGRRSDLYQLEINRQDLPGKDQPAADAGLTGKSRPTNRQPSAPPLHREPSVEPSEEPPRPEVARLCELMAKLSNERTDPDGKRKEPRYKVTKAWLDEMRRLIDIDGRSPELIERAIHWVDRHPFWGANVLAVPKLRAQFDKLYLQAKRENGRGNGVGPSSEDLRTMAAELRARGQ